MPRRPPRRISRSPTRRTASSRRVSGGCALRCAAGIFLIRFEPRAPQAFSSHEGRVSGPKGWWVGEVEGSDQDVPTANAVGVSSTKNEEQEAGAHEEQIRSGGETTPAPTRICPSARRQIQPDPTARPRPKMRVAVYQGGDGRVHGFEGMVGGGGGGKRSGLCPDRLSVPKERARTHRVSGGCALRCAAGIFLSTPRVLYREDQARVSAVRLSILLLFALSFTIPHEERRDGPRGRDETEPAPLDSTVRPQRRARRIMRWGVSGRARLLPRRRLPEGWRLGTGQARVRVWTWREGGGRGLGTGVWTVEGQDRRWKGRIDGAERKKGRGRGIQGAGPDAHLRACVGGDCDTRIMCAAHAHLPVSRMDADADLGRACGWTRVGGCGYGWDGEEGNMWGGEELLRPRFSLLGMHLRAACGGVGLGKFYFDPTYPLPRDQTPFLSAASDPQRLQMIPTRHLPSSARARRRSAARASPSKGGERDDYGVTCACAGVLADVGWWASGCERGERDRDRRTDAGKAPQGVRGLRRNGWRVSAARRWMLFSSAQALGQMPRSRLVSFSQVLCLDGLRVWFGGTRFGGEERIWKPGEEGRRELIGERAPP
ncbi:hypothetical protein DFH07DRAFT_783997 [Mycena maculata]|uniref:Uncharacterized protein n=1 Tax=Mycena maculata TaxID=230809 RepID=A0AAD7HJ07_9AGAR|nr:hypothetical protein DFH07DRAFT_783997 [Mycena maculata]